MMDKVCQAVGGVVSGTGEAITDGIGAWIAKSMGELAASAADLAARSVDSTTRVDLNAAWFRDNYELVLPLALTLTVGTFCLQLIHAAWRRDERALVQAVTGTVTGILFAFAAISCTTVALTAVDALSAGLFQAANTSFEEAVRRVVRVSELGAMYPLGWGVPSLVALACAFGAFLYWCVMVFRKVGILILVILAPFAGAGGGWEAARRWRRGWIEATATLVVSKLLMTIVFLVGVSALGDSDTSDGLSALSDALAGLVVLVLVLFCPFATYKFVHWAADGGNGDDLHRGGAAGLAAVSGAARTVTGYAQMGRGAGPAPQGPSTVPGADRDGVATSIGPSGMPDPVPSRFRYGEDPDAPGDKGRPLLRRPPTSGDRGRPLLRHAEQGREAQGAAATAGSDSGVGTAVPVIHHPPSATKPAPPSGPPPHGSATPQRWTRDHSPSPDRTDP
jgi:hypothetical protein